MKVKYLFIILGIVFTLFIYFNFCYFVLNMRIDTETKNIISGYLNSSCNNCEYNYQYISATPNKDDTINVYINVDSEFLEEYYKFVIKTDYYHLVDVNNDIPIYIKKPL